MRLSTRDRCFHGRVALYIAALALAAYSSDLLFNSAHHGGLISLGVPLAYARVLLDGTDAFHAVQGVTDTVQVKSAQELKRAILAGAARIHFVQSFALSEELFPEPPATCHKSPAASMDPNPTSFRDCAPNAVIYSLPDNTEDASSSESALWTADSSVVLDVRYLFRGIHLERDLEINGMTLAQGVDDRNPYIFLFGGLPSTQGVTLTITGSVLMSQCGGQRASHVDQMLSMAFPDARKETDEIVRSSVSYNSFAPLDLPSPAGNEPDALTVHLQDTHITCYRLPGPFEAPHPPGIWIPGTVSGVERSDDTCQRATTLGADYRGTGSTTVGGAACLQWGFQTAGEPVVTEATVPGFGVGAHNYCRNPDRSAGGLWCYAADEDGNTARAACDVPVCSDEEEAKMAAAAAAAAGIDTSSSTPEDTTTTPEDTSSVDASSSSESQNASDTADNKKNSDTDTDTDTASDQNSSSKPKLGEHSTWGLSTAITLLILGLIGGAVYMLWKKRDEVRVGDIVNQVKSWRPRGFSDAQSQLLNPFMTKMANANNNPSEQRALTTHSLSYLKRPAGGRPKPSQTEGSGSDDYDSGVDSDSENAAEEFSIFSKPIKPSDCKVHKVKLPNLIDPDMTQGLRNVPMPSPRGWNTPREFHPLPADYSGDTSADHDGRNPDLDRTLDTMLTDAGLDDVMEENLLAGSLPLAFNGLFSVSPESSPQRSDSTQATSRRVSSSDGSSTLSTLNPMHSRTLSSHQASSSNADSARTVAGTGAYGRVENVHLAALEPKPETQKGQSTASTRKLWTRVLRGPFGRGGKAKATSQNESESCE